MDLSKNLSKNKDNKNKTEYSFFNQFFVAQDHNILERMDGDCRHLLCPDMGFHLMLYHLHNTVLNEI